MRLAENLGYVEEARFRRARIVAGAYYDGMCYGVLREEWEARYRGGLLSVAVMPGLSEKVGRATPRPRLKPLQPCAPLTACAPEADGAGPQGAMMDAVFKGKGNGSWPGLLWQRATGSAPPSASVRFRTGGRSAVTGSSARQAQARRVFVFSLKGTLHAVRPPVH